MPFEVKLSELQGVNFKAMVEHYLVDKIAYDKHVLLVAKGEADPYPPPDAHHLVKSAIKNNKPDYKIIDDVTPTLEQRKELLMIEVNKAQEKAIYEIMPKGRRALHDIKHTEARIAHSSSQGLIFKRKPTKAQKAIFDVNDDLSKRTGAVLLHGANLKVEIEELTDKTIDAWKIKKFPT